MISQPFLSEANRVFQFRWIDQPPSHDDNISVVSLYDSRHQTSTSAQHDPSGTTDEIGCVMSSDWNLGMYKFVAKLGLYGKAVTSISLVPVTSITGPGLCTLRCVEESRFFLLSTLQSEDHTPADREPLRCHYTGEQARDWAH